MNYNYTFENVIKEKQNFIEDFKLGKELLGLRRYGFQENTDGIRFIVARRWNSWYPSYFSVEGGCYVIEPRKGGIIVIDPGFKFLNVLRKHFNIDPSDIKTIIVSHFHPDHMGGLIEFLTFAFRAGLSCNIYLNETSYEFFRAFHAKKVKINELLPEQTIRLTEKGGSNDEIILKPFRVFHREIGLRHRSLGFNIIFKLGGKRGKVYKLTLLGDTDGRPEYIRYYVDKMSRSNVVVLHIGTFYGEESYEIGYKHLYYKGVKKILKEIMKRRNRREFSSLKLIILSEFGLEFASSSEIMKGAEDFFEHEKFFMLLRCYKIINDYNEFKKYMYFTALYKYCFNKKLSNKEKIKIIISWIVLYKVIQYIRNLLNKLENTSNINRKIINYFDADNFISSIIDNLITYNDNINSRKIIEDIKSFFEEDFKSIERINPNELFRYIKEFSEITLNQIISTKLNTELKDILSRRGILEDFLSQLSLEELPKHFQELKNNIMKKLNSIKDKVYLSEKPLKRYLEKYNKNELIELINFLERDAKVSEVKILAADIGLELLFTEKDIKIRDIISGQPVSIDAIEMKTDDEKHIIYCSAEKLSKEFA